MKKKVIYQKKRNFLEGEELLRVEELIRKEIFIKFRQETSQSIFYRCKLCRKSTLRYDKQIKKFFKTKGHTHHCRSHFIAGVKKEEEEKSQQRALFKIPKVSEKEVKIFQETFKKAMAGRTFMDDNFISPLFQEEPTTYLDEVQSICQENEEIFLKFKERCRQKIYGPVIIEKDLEKGYLVRTTNSIPALSLICEYAGQIVRYDPDDPDYIGDDSLMDYVSIEDRDYVIWPVPMCNLGRFINGINNSKKSNNKENLKSMTFKLNGRVHIVLYAKRKIEKGEELMYNYNSGRLKEYKTSNFK